MEFSCRTIRRKWPQKAQKDTLQIKLLLILLVTKLCSAPQVFQKCVRVNLVAIEAPHQETLDFYFGQSGRQ